MPSTMAKPDQRPHAESFRTDSQPDRSPSRQVRMTAKAEYLSALNETRSRIGISIEAMAINADCPVSSMSDALAGKEGRNFAGHWLLAQGDDFIATFNRIVEEKRGLTPQAKRSNKARKLAELLAEIVEDIA